MPSGLKTHYFSVISKLSEIFAIVQSTMTGQENMKYLKKCHLKYKLFTISSGNIYPTFMLKPWPQCQSVSFLKWDKCTVQCKLLPQLPTLLFFSCPFSFHVIIPLLLLLLPHYHAFDKQIVRYWSYWRWYLPQHTFPQVIPATFFSQSSFLTCIKSYP